MKELGFHFLIFMLAGNTKIELLQKLESTRHFEKVKPLFDVDNKEMLLKKLNDFYNIYSASYRRGFARLIPNIE